MWSIYKEDKIMEYEEWLATEVSPGMIMEEYIDLELAESGADREMCFDLEAEQTKRYEEYLKGKEKCKNV